jgi:hypothetical protein
MHARNNKPPHNDPDPAKLLFALIPVVKPPENAIMCGPMSVIMAGIQDSDLISQTRSDAISAINDATSRLAKADQREAELERREQELNAREAMLNDTTRRVVDFAGKLGSMFDAIEKHRADQLAGPLPDPPGFEPEREPVVAPVLEDEGELEAPKSAKDPKEQNPTFDDQGTETEFPSPGDPDLPEPLPRDPGGDNK